ncbi:MAG TPA: DNA-formamidopyrimidine glycosylase family protein [Acidimicrobiia bacterium]
MPELIEVEQARALIAERALGRVITDVDAPDRWYLKRGLTPRGARTALPGRALVTARRRGKQLLLDTSDRLRAEYPGPQGATHGVDRAGPVLGLHLGMSGRVLIDDEAAGDPLVYASNREVIAWHRFTLRFADGGRLALRDPRRLGAVELDPDEERLGVDALEVTLPQLRAVLARSRAPVKAVLMNQARIAGLGNLLVDEILWRAGIAPDRIASSVDAAEQVALHRAVRTTLRTLGRRGGSHTGDLMVARVPGGCCPRDGAPLVRRSVAGRTSYWCPVHQV